ncbi:ribosomal protein S18 [Cladorrhinum sp. PSN332]|nr:ribosomal protein S18 [Cladorrhinum sp. PSN332]
MSTKQFFSAALRGLSKPTQPSSQRLFSSTPLRSSASPLGPVPVPGFTSSPTINRSIFPSRLTNPTTTTTTHKSPTDALASIISESRERGAALTDAEKRQVTKADFQETVNSTRASTTTDAFVRQMPRRWRTGDVYAPRDLSPVEMRKWRRPSAPKTDVVDMLGFSPVDNYRNPSLISEFMTDHGRIKHSKFTGLRPVNQRKIAKAVRRAIGLGLHPSVHKHPEILQRVARRTLGVAYRPDIEKGSSAPKY